MYSFLIINRSVYTNSRTWDEYLKDVRSLLTKL